MPRQSESVNCDSRDFFARYGVIKVDTPDFFKLSPKYMESCLSSSAFLASTNYYNQSVKNKLKTTYSHNLTNLIAEPRMLFYMEPIYDGTGILPCDHYDKVILYIHHTETPYTLYRG